jgi:signal transduction histidine kinase/flagellar biosynthesis chaperone FliJ
MPVLAEASEILSTSIGGTVYHLLLFWAVALSLGMAWGERWRARHEQTKRLFVGMGGLALLRGLYVGAAFVVAGGWVDQVLLLPPLERFVDAASVGLLAWAFVPPSRSSSRTWYLTLGSVLVLTLGACVASTFFWAQMLAENPLVSYNRTWQAMAWAAWQALLALVGVVAIVRSQCKSWGILAVALALMLLGAVSLWYLPVVAAHLPIWQRLANLVAYPLVAAAVYREIVSGLHTHSRDLEDLSQASLDQIKSLLYLFEASQQTASSLDLSTVLDNAVRGISRVLDADQCAIAFPEQTNPGQMRLVAIHNPTRQGRGEAVSFPLEYQLTVQQAIRRKKGIVVEESDNVQLKVLFALLGSAETGPLLVQPLLDQGEAIGAIIVGNARSHRPFSANEAKLCQSMAEQVVGAIQNARRYQAVQKQMQAMSEAEAGEQGSLKEARAELQELEKRLDEAGAEAESLRQQEEAAREARDALQIELARNQAENDALLQQVAGLEADLAQARARVEAWMGGRGQEVAPGGLESGEVVPAGDSIQGLLQGLTAGILVVGSDGSIEQANAAAEVLLDCSREELRGLDLAAVSDDERWQEAISTARGGEAVRLRIRMGMSALLCDVAPLLDGGDNGDDMPRLVAILQDVTVEADEQRGQLKAIASLAEGLRTPVTTISSYTDLLLGETMGILGGNQREFLMQVKAGAARIAQIAGKLTHAAMTDEQWTAPQRQTVDVNKLIEVAIASTHRQLEDRELRLTLDMQEDLPQIAADPGLLRRILDSLLSNAFLASKVGGQVGIRTIQSSSPPEGQELELNGDGFVIVSITDSGGGLSDEALGRIFEPDRPSQAVAGLGESGEGLVLVKTLVEAHGGRLWVESKKGKGTTFSFVLPVSKLRDDGHG